MNSAEFYVNQAREIVREFGSNMEIAEMHWRKRYLDSWPKHDPLAADLVNEP